MTSRRTLLWPTSEATFDADAELTQLVEPGGEVEFGAAAVAGDDGGDAIERKLSARGLRSMLPSTWVWVSIKPGARTRSRASMVRAAVAFARGPMAAIRPSFTATSARYQGFTGAIDDAGVADEQVVIGSGEKQGDEEKGERATHTH